MRPSRVTVAAVTTVAFVVPALLLLGGAELLGSGDRDVLAPVAMAAMGLLATVCAGVAARASGGGQRLAWSVMASGVGAWTLGAAVWCVAALGGTSIISNGSSAELGYLLLSVCGLGAAVLVPYRDGARLGVGLGLLLDGIVAAASLVLALGSFVLSTSATVTIPTMLFATVTGFYLGLTVMSLIVVRAADPDRRLSPALMAGGFAFIGAAGSLHIRHRAPDLVPSGIVTVGWIAGAYLFALSAIVSRPGPDLDANASGSTSRLSVWLPYVPAAVAIAIGSVHFWPATPVDSFLFSIGVIVMIAVLARHMLALERKRRLLEAMADAALHDTVTGLANRRLLDERLDYAVQLHRRLRVPLSVLSIKVDDFQMVTDALGYAASDALLRSVGERIHSSVRGGDTVARLGGEEFAILVEDGHEVAAQVARRMAEAFETAPEIDAIRVNVHLSVGVATAQPGDESMIMPVDLLGHAEAARSRAEQTSGTDVQIFTPDKDAPVSRRQTFRDGVARLQLLWDLRRAIEDRSLTLVYQPQFEMMTGTVWC